MDLDRKVKTMHSLYVIGLLMMVGIGERATATPFPASFLKGPCGLETDVTGVIPAVGAWLRCGESRMLLAHPLNLFGHVNVDSSAKALEFVRLFSSRETFRFFPWIARVEVIVGGQDDIYALPGDQLAKLSSVRVQSIAAPGGGGRRAFEIHRPLVILADGKLYEATEVVHEDGFYQMVSTRLISDDIKGLGIRRHVPIN
jgi:hypothetical protein